MEAPDRPARANRARILGAVLAAVLLAWVLYDIRAPQFWSHIKGLRWGLAALGVAADSLGYVFQGVRFRVLIRPLARLSLVRAVQSIYAGVFLNETMPLHLGDLARSYLTSRWAGVGLLSVVPLIVLERIFEGLWLALGVGLTAVFVRLPKDVLAAADIFGLIVLGLAALLILLVSWDRRVSHRPAAGGKGRGAWPARVHAVLAKLGLDLGGVRFSPPVLAALGLSLPVLAGFALGFWILLEAYGLRLPLLQAAAVYLIVHVGISVPLTPAAAGSYQFFCVLGLGLFGIEKTRAAAFSVVAYVVLTVPLLLFGALAAARTGVGFRDLAARLEKFRRGKEAEHG